MEFWDIYDKDKKPTGRTMKKNDWILKDGEYHLSVLGVIHRPDGRFLITQRVMTKAGHRAGGRFQEEPHRQVRAHLPQSAER